MASEFENRIVFLLIVIIVILLAMLWGAYNAYIKLERKLDEVSNKGETVLDKASEFYDEHRKAIPQVISEIKKYFTGVMGN